MKGNVAVRGARAREPLPRARTLAAVGQVAAERNVALQAVDAGAVCGRDHLVHAAQLAARAIARGDTIADDAGVEVALWLAGDDQISRALATVGIPDPARDLGLVAIGPDADAALDALMAALDLDPDDDVLVETKEVLERLGVPATPGVDPVELAMEHSALLATRA